MDDLKLLIGMVTNLPALAVWMLVGYLIYKVVVVSSVYGVIRLVILKVHDWATKPKDFKIGVKPINTETAQALNVQLTRLSGNSPYISMYDIKKLQEALDKVKGVPSE